MHIFQFISGLAHTCRTEHYVLTCQYSKAQKRDHFGERHRVQGQGTASGMLRKAQLCLKDRPGASVKLFLSTPLEDSCFPFISKSSHNCKAGGDRPFFQQSSSDSKAHNTCEKSRPQICTNTELKKLLHEMGAEFYSY